MSREVGFYLMVPGLCIYIALLCLICYGPLMLATRGPVPGDILGFYSFLFLLAYPIAMLLILLGNRGLRLFRVAWLLPLSFLPFLAVALWIGFH